MKDRKLYALLEDSKPRSFGGGQAISLKIIDILKKQNLEIWDSSDKTIFQKKVKALNLEKSRFKYYLLKNNHSNRGKLSQRSSFSINVTRFILEIITDFPYSIFKLIKTNSNVIFSTTKKTHLIILLASLINKNIKRIILYHHSYYPDIIFSFLYKFLIKIIVFLIKEKVKVTHVFVSNFGLKSFTPSKRKNMFVIYNTVNNEKLLISMREESKKLCLRKNKIISVYSSLIPWKGILELIKGYESLEKDIRKEYPLRIYGDGIQKDMILNLCSKIDNLSYKGFCSPEIILQESCITICSSISFENCPISVLESIASGKPTFSLGIGGQNEILHKNNKFINCLDNEKLISSLVKLSDDELLKICEMNALDYDQNYSSSIFERKIKNNLIDK